MAPTIISAEQIDLIQDSWSRVPAQSNEFAALFYQRLFITAPEIRPLFKDDMSTQWRKLMVMLATVVNKLPDWPSLAPAVRALGRRHADYGVCESHYERVAEALLWSLQRSLGEHFTPAVKEAWTRAYSALATAMRTASTPHQAA